MMNIKKTNYYKSFKAIKGRSLLHYIAVDALFFILLLLTISISLAFFKVGYSKFYQKVPQLMSIQNLLSNPEQEVDAATASLFEASLGETRTSVQEFVLYTSGAGTFFLLMLVVLLSTSNWYIWNKIKKRKADFKTWLNYLGVTAILLLLFTSIFLLIILSIHTSLAVYLIFLELIVMFYSFNTAYSLTGKKFVQTLKATFTKIFLNLKGYCSAYLTNLVTIVIVMNLSALLTRISLVFTTLSIAILFVWLTWTRIQLQILTA